MQLSVHFRGPIQLKQFAVYNPGSSQAKRSPHQRRHNHGHAHFHEHNKEVRDVQDKFEAEKRAVGDLVFATINGQLVSWTNAYNGLPTSATPSSSSDNGIVSSSAVIQSQSTISSPSAASTSQVTSSSAALSAYTPVATGDWVQSAYYESGTGTANGVTFLNNIGGGGLNAGGGNGISGVWDA